MKKITLSAILFFIINVSAKAQLSDSSLMKKLSINNFCLCQTTLSKLKDQFVDLKEASIEEMDLAKGCFGQDSRFIAGSGFSTEKFPGLIFQKDQETDFISKIRLTPKFKGKLPNGSFIDLGKLTLKDLSRLYPNLKDKWGSRGCSDYWNFSNDTISFFVKIDKNKLPQFPVDEAYYLNKPVEGIDLVMSCYSLEKNKPSINLVDESNDPVFFLDSIRVNRGVLSNYEPSEIASLTVFKGSDAIKKGGTEAKNGLIYIETKGYAKMRYWNYLKSKSKAYLNLVSAPDNDLNIQYILNGKVLKENFEGDLSIIDDKTFKGVEIITKEQLAKDYSVTDKEFGVVIHSDVPRNLKNGNNKF